MDFVEQYDNNEKSEKKRYWMFSDALDSFFSSSVDAYEYDDISLL